MNLILHDALLHEGNGAAESTLFSLGSSSIYNLKVSCQQTYRPFHPYYLSNLSFHIRKNDLKRIVKTSLILTLVHQPTLHNKIKYT
jgi:hypothetical protein